MNSFILVPDNKFINTYTPEIEVVSESGTSGEIHFSTFVSGWYNVTLVGGGGGGRGNLGTGSGGRSNHTGAAGGSGAAFIGKIYFDSSSSYILKIGSGGKDRNDYPTDLWKLGDGSTFNASRSTLMNKKYKGNPISNYMSKDCGDTTLYENGIPIITVGGGKGAGCAPYYYNMRGLGGTIWRITNSWYKTNYDTDQNYLITSTGTALKYKTTDITGKRTIKDSKNKNGTKESIVLGLTFEDSDANNKIRGRLVKGNDGMYGIRHSSGTQKKEWWHSYGFSAYYGLKQDNKHYGNNGLVIIHFNDVGDRCYYDWLSSSEIKSYIRKEKTGFNSFNGSKSIGAGGATLGDGDDNGGISKASTSLPGEDGYGAIKYKTGGKTKDYNIKILYNSNSSEGYTGYAVWE